MYDRFDILIEDFDKVVVVFRFGIFLVLNVILDSV